MTAYKAHLIPKLLDNLVMYVQIKKSCQATGITYQAFWQWMIASRNGDPQFQNITWSGVTAPLHVLVEGAATITAQMIEAEARARALQGSYVQSYFQGEPVYHKRDPKEIADLKELGIWDGDEFARDKNGERIPVMMHIVPPASLVEKMLSAHFPKRYGQHATLDVKHGGVLRIDKNATAQQSKELPSFDDDEETTERKGGFLAVPPPALSSDEFEQRAAEGEFDAQPVEFKQNDGSTVTRMAEPDPLLTKDAQIAALQPKPDDRPDIVALKERAIAKLLEPEKEKTKPGAIGLRLPPAALPDAPPPTSRGEQDHVGRGVVAEGGYKVSG